MFKTFGVLAFAMALVGCGSIEQRSTIEQRMGEPRFAGVGDVVLRVSTEKSLPNAFGKADIFGRTTPTGSTTLIYEGVQSGRAVFSRRSVDIDTRATTMNSSPIVISNSSTTAHSGQVGGVPFSGHSTTTGPTVVIPPNTPEPIYFERSKNIIALDISRLPLSFVVEGVMVRVLDAEPLAVRFVLER